MNILIRLLMVAIMLSAFLAGAQAQTPRPRPLPINPLEQIGDKIKQDFTARTGVQATGDVPYDLLRALDKKLLPDLQYALKLATATNSKVTAPCYQAWIDMINTQDKAVQDPTGADLPVPDPHIITDFERLVELRNALQPESDFMIKCSPVASMVKKDIAGFMGVVISGGAGIATLVPGL
jgi:hypothetical protein